MPRKVSPNMVVEYENDDGMILRARIERRPEGTYAIDLRKWKKGRPTLKQPGAATGVTDEASARRLARVELERLAGGTGVSTHAATGAPLTEVADYVQRKLRDGRMVDSTAEQAEKAIARCWFILRRECGLSDWSEYDRDHTPVLVDGLYKVTHRGKPLKRNSVLKHLNYLKGFVRHMEDRKRITTNPVHRHTAIPAHDDSFVRDWLTPAQMGLLLETSFGLRPSYPHNACHAWPEILATECYTGAREDEVLGLEMADLRLGTGGERGYGTLRFDHNRWRRIKNTDSVRTFSLWEAHAELLDRYLTRTQTSRHGLLFPNKHGVMWSELRESMARDMASAGIEKHITDHSLRHSYISARSRMYREIVRGGQVTLVPVHLKDIIREVGHGSERMAREVYDHDSDSPVEGWTVLDYTAALAEERAARPARVKRGRHSASDSTSSAARRASASRRGVSSEGR